MHQLTKFKKISIYQRMVEANVPISNWQSDLYVPVTQQTTDILKMAQSDGVLHSVTRFKDQVTGKMYYDIPFMFDPFYTMSR